MIYGGNTLYEYLRMYRCCWLRGRMGSGKTALAHKLAYDLISAGHFRYLVSNIRSVWNDAPADVLLREGVFVDAVIILDEGGIFAEGSYKAKKYLQYLRKMNCCVMVPSFLKPAAVMRDFSIKRSINWEIAGIPVWSYRYFVTDGVDNYHDWFHWIRPYEVFGVFDTGGFPSSDAGLEDWMVSWTKKAAAATGYEYVPSGSFTVGNGTPSGSGDIVETVRGVSTAIEEITSQTSDLVSLLEIKSKK